MADPVRIQWELHTRADLETAWMHLSDTDRFNRVAELGFTFSEAPDEGGDVVRVGHMTKLGLSLSWDELPFVYRAPNWFRTRRIFHSGPAAEFTASLRLKATSQGTSILYTVEVVPRNALTAPVVAIELKTQTHAQLDRALKLLVSELDEGVAPRDKPAGPLTAAGEARLAEGLGAVDGKVAAHLADFLRAAPLREQARISPRPLATRWGLDEETVTAALLQATRADLLSIQWSVLCPSCRQPKARLAPGQAQVHCASCNIYYDATFPDALAVTWTPHPAVRDVELPVDCIGSPALQRHIVAQDEVPAGGVLELSLDLAPGAYRVRTWPMRGTASLDVYDDALATSLEVRATDDALDPPLLRTTPGRRYIKVLNDASRPFRILLEKRPRDPDVTTLGRLLQHHPTAAALLPFDRRHDQVERWTGAALAVRGRSQPELTHARSVYSSSQGQIATYATAQDCVQSLRNLGALDGLSVGVATGAVLDVLVGERRIPTGPAVDGALGAMASVPRGIAATPAVMDEDLDAALQSLGLTRRTAAFPTQNGIPVHWLR